MLLRVGGCLCGIPLDVVAETMRPLPVHQLPRCPRFVLGAARIRGVATPVVDLRTLLAGSSDSSQSPEGTEQKVRPRFVTVRVKHDGNERIVALRVDAVHGISELKDGDLSELPPLFEGAAQSVSRLGTLDDELFQSLNVGHLFPEEYWLEVDECDAAREQT